MSLSIDDFIADSEIESDSIKNLVSLCDRIKVADEFIMKLEDRLKEAKDRRNHIIEHEIPEVMDEIGMKEFKLNNGKKITIKNVIAANISLANKENALAWLEENNHSDIIKTQLQVNFNREDYDKAKELERDLMESDYIVTSSSAVHPQTLKSFVKEQIEMGVDIPKELFGVYLTRRAVIK